MNLLRNYILIILIAAGSVAGQNILSILDNSGNAKDTISVELSIANSDNFVAFQTDIELPVELEFIDGSAVLSSRATNHNVSANIVNGSILRIIVFSLDQSLFSGNDGTVLTFDLQLGTDPGSYTLTPTNSIISDNNSNNILTGEQSGSIDIYAPDIRVSSSSINFEEIPLGGNNQSTITLYNDGNTELIVDRVYTDNQYFQIIGDTTFSVPAFSNRSLTIQFNSIEKGSYNQKLTILSNDPDAPKKEVTLTAVAFAVNELHMLPSSGRSGYPVKINFTINNMEPFVGFQFDLDLPSVLTYQPDSVWLSSRKTDHSVSANMIDANTLRVVAFSPNNTPFNGVDGEVLTLGFMLDGTGGNYNMNLNNVIITDSTAENIISEYYTSYVNIKSPDISANNSYSFGEVSILDTSQYNYRINNYGNDTLIVSQISSSNNKFWYSANLPLRVPENQYVDIPVYFHSSGKGAFTGRFTFRNNDPDEDPFYLNVSADAFVPNVLGVRDTFAVANDTATISLFINNYEEFVAFQVDLIVPDSLNYIDGSANLSNRSNSHQISVGPVPGRESDNYLRVVVFSLSQNAFTGNSGVVAQLKFTTGDVLGNYPINLSDGIISNSNSENILHSLENGTIQLLDPSPTMNPLPTLELGEDQNYSFPVSSWFQYVSDPNNSDDELNWTFSQSANFTINLNNDSIHVSPVSNWNGTDTITVSVDDGENNDSNLWIIKVNPVNDGIEVITEIDDQSYTEDVGEVEVVANLDGVFRDIDGDVLQYSYSSAETILSAEIRNDKSLWITTKFDAFGLEEIIVTASDGEFTATDTFVVEIRPRNDAPIVSGIPNIVLREDGSETIDLDGYVVDADTDTSDITWSSVILSAGELQVSSNRKKVTNKEDGEPIRVGPEDLTIEIDPVTHVATITASRDSVGVFNVEFTAEDDSGAVGRDTIEVRLNPVNDGIEVIAEIEDQSYIEDVGEVEAVEDLDTIFRDIDGDELQYSYASAETILSVEIRNGKSLWITTKLDAFGTEEIIVIASDGEFAAKDTFTVELRPINDAPVVSDIPDLVLLEDESEEIDLDGYVSDVDTDTSKISWTSRVLGAEELRIGIDDLTVDIDPVTHIATITVSRDSVGLFEVEFTAEDDSGAVGRDTITVRLNPVNDGIEVIAEISDVSYREDVGEKEVVSNLDEIFRDIDGDELQYSYSSAENILTVEIRNGKSLWITTKLDAFGSEDLIVTASDGEYTAKDTFTVEIRPINDAPVVDGIPDVVVKIDSTYQFSLLPYISDVDDSTNKLSLNYQKNSTGIDVSINANGLVEILGKEIGEYGVVFLATDDSLSTGRDTISVDVTSGDITSNIIVDNSWNLLSIPVEAEDMAKTTLFENAVSNAFFFENGYVKKDTLRTAVGFWLKYDSIDTLKIVGQPVTNPSEVSSGWNIIGPLENPIAVTDVNTSPEGIIVSNFFAFESGYIKPDSLHPGKGYWVKVNQSGSIYYDSPSNGKSNNNQYITSDLNLGELASISVIDNSLNSKRLYFGDAFEKDKVELPPLPPNGIFDIRFSDDTYLRDLSDTQNHICFNSADYPIKIKVSGIDVGVKDIIDGSIVNKVLRDGEEIIISDKRINKLQIEPAVIPIEYTLYQNYPNPFNPSTVIKYGIPNDSKVEIDVYNSIGQKVVTLIDEKLEAGYHELEFNAYELSSGIYFYRIIAGEFTSVKKMILIK